MKTIDKVLSEVLRDGPMKASFPSGRRGRGPSVEQVATSPAGWRSPELPRGGSTKCLEEEQRRLVRTWGGLEDEAGNFWGYSYNRDGKRVLVCIPAREEG